MAIIHKLHEAIRELHTNAASINGDDLDTCTVWDDDGTQIMLQQKQKNYLTHILW